MLLLITVTVCGVLGLGRFWWTHTFYFVCIVSDWSHGCILDVFARRLLCFTSTSFYCSYSSSAADVVWQLSVNLLTHVHVLIDWLLDSVELSYILTRDSVTARRQGRAPGRSQKHPAMQWRPQLFVSGEAQRRGEVVPTISRCSYDRLIWRTVDW